MTVAPDPPYTKTPGEVYQARLDGLVGHLQNIADQVHRLGKPHTSVRTLRLDHVDAAMRVHRVVLRQVEQLRLDSLLLAAVEADHPDANLLPGVMLDKAAAAIEAHVPTSAGHAAELAEVALRAVGLLR